MDKATPDIITPKHTLESPIAAQKCFLNQNIPISCSALPFSNGGSWALVISKGFFRKPNTSYKCPQNFK
jgi:hypothetical protein